MAAVLSGHASDFETIYNLGLFLDRFPSRLTPSEDGSFYGVLGGGGRSGSGSIFHLNADATQRTLVFDFADATTNFVVSSGALVAIRSNALYGYFEYATPTNNVFSLYRVNPDGSEFTTLRDLPSIFGAPLLASDHRFYLPNSGRLDRFEEDGTGLTKVASFEPRLLFESSDGMLYGGGAGTNGVFRMNKDGTGLMGLVTLSQILYSLTEGNDHRLYYTVDNFPNGQVAFAVNRDGSGTQNLGGISSSGQDSGISSLVDGGDGHLYAVFSVGPAFPASRLITIGTAGGVSTVLNFTANYGGDVTLGSDGRLYGVKSPTIYVVNRDGTGLTDRFRFDNVPGVTCESALTYGKDGLIYGTTRAGGAGDRGAVFRLNTDGSGYALIRQFANDAEGSGPRGGVIEGKDGALYGVTVLGGTNHGGTVFKLNKDGTGFTNLVHFGPATGTNPVAMVLEGSDEAIYGSCQNGGNTATNGTLWKVQKDGSGFTVLRKFAANGSEGRQPFAPLMEGADGLIYGTTDIGGSANKGVVFKLAKDGTAYQMLRNLTGFGDAATPEGRLLQLPDGTLIGTAAAGGSAALGAIYHLQTNGTGYQVIHSFISTNSDARTPIGGLIPAGDGSLLGATRFGGGEASGTVYQINPDGTGYQILHRFSANYPSGLEPWAALTPGPNGVIFGSTTLGGSAFGGTIFRLSLGSQPLTLALSYQGQLFINVSGPSGSKVRIDCADSLNLPSWWQVLTRFSLRSGSTNFMLPSPVDPQRFYRAVIEH